MRQNKDTDVPAPPALHLGVFAELNARISAGGKRSDVLAEAKVDPEHWEASQEFWLGRMAEEASRERYALTMKYTALYQAALTRWSQAQAQARLAKPVRRVAPFDANRVVVHAAPAVPPRPAPGSSDVPPASNAPPSVAPPSRAPAPHVARLTVEQLAAMRAELATSPEAEHPAVRTRFGLDDLTWELEEAHWQRQLAVDQELFARYLKRFQYCRSLLQRT
jgi:hypothetical protein